MHRITFLLSFFLFLTTAQAQFSDSFDDGDFIMNPEWSGDVGDFRVENNELQLFSAAAGKSALHTAYNLQDSLTFKQLVRMDFAPSGSNKLKLWLVSSEADNDAADGLFFTLGESGGDDALVLHYQEGGSEQEIRRFGAIPHGSKLQVYWEINWIDQNKWQFNFDYNGDGSFDEIENLEFATSFSGQVFYRIECTYTSSRKEHFFFDNIEATPIVRDLDAPVLLGAEPISKSIVEVTFDEAIQDVTGMANLFTLNPGNLKPSNVSWSSAAPQKVTLTFDPSLTNNTTYTLDVSGVKDVANNVSNAQQTEFLLLIGVTPVQGQLVINEILPAPSSSAILPNVEYVELYNNSDEILALDEVQFSDATSEVTLPKFNLAPKSYILLVEAGEEGLLAGFGEVLGVANFPTLNNSGDLLTLKNSLGEQLDLVDYEDDWYGEESQSGVSLERISLVTNCTGRANWGVSEDARGGTPDEVNSIFYDGEVEADLVLDRLSVVDTRTIELAFNLPVISNDLNDLISISPTLGIDYIQKLNEGLLFEIGLSEDIQESQFYTLTINPGAEACNGSVNTNAFEREFAIPSAVSSGDLIISEVLYDPLSGGKEFIEIYNASDKIVSVDGLTFLLTREDESTTETYLRNKTAIGPKKYYVLTEGVTDILSKYTVPFPEQVIEDDIPSLTNSGGTLKLYMLDFTTGDTVVIDEAKYSPEFHSPLLTDTKGRSLEKTALTGSGLLETYWFSATDISGKATPTGENSQQFTGTPPEESFELSSKTFSPDQDGFEDWASLNYQFKEPGYITTIKVFSYNGHLVKELANNAILDLTGSIFWYGDDDEGDVVPMGIYYMVVEAYAPNGEVINEKHKIVLAKRLN